MKTNRTLKLITLTAAIFGFAASSFGQSSATASTVTASATIIAPITITNNTSLNFGVIVPGTTEGSVTLPADGGTRTTTGGTSVLTSQTGNPTLAAFTVTGQANYTYSITLPTSIPLEGGGSSMNVTNFTSSIGTGIGVAGITIQEDGTSTFNVGATIAVGASEDQPVGAYTGSFDVTVAYE